MLFISLYFTSLGIVSVDPGAEAGSGCTGVLWRRGCVCAEGGGPERCAYDHAMGMALGGLPRRGDVEAGIVNDS